MFRKLAVGLILIAIVAGGLSTVTPQVAAQDDEFIFGVVLVGPRDDHGWSEAHYNAGLYVQDNLPGARMIELESLNSADRPETTLDQVVQDMVDQGAELILTTSADFEVDTTVVAEQYPDVTFVNVSGDDALWGIAPENLGNFMGQMEYGKMIAGCAAALKTQTGQIGYIGPLIDPETVRLTNSVYLGARHCYEEYRGLNPDDLQFGVTWIGFWFNIPGVTLDPTEVANNYLDSGVDVLISGIDTTEAIVVAGQRAAEGAPVWAIPYDFEGACSEAPDICLGVPYFNWGPKYLETVQAVQDGTWEAEWDWMAPDWSDINNHDTSAVGFNYGDALTEEERAMLDEFIAALAAGAQGEEGGLNLWTGPLNFQDGSVFLEEGEVATEKQIWFQASNADEAASPEEVTPQQLLEGVEGTSS
ncbi:MAG: BMP family ABC transporter substrate-binding protein [Chloroflexi bacterium]|nr:BMP family ABC transporter substrate-binding protein [Chloroflexota bacterium]